MQPTVPVGARLLDASKTSVGRMFVYAVGDDETVSMRMVHCERHVRMLRVRLR